MKPSSMAATLIDSRIDILQGIPAPRRRSDAETSSSSVSEIVQPPVVEDIGRRSVCLSSSSSENSLDLENAGGGVLETETKVKVKRDCRICHLSFDDGSNPESGFTIELGCSCKNDLAAAHQHCAQAWFKIRGNKICEICGSTARNVVGVNEVELIDQWNEAHETAEMPTFPPQVIETRRFWQGHRFLNFLLACMVFAFVISWLFHFNVPS